MVSLVEVVHLRIEEKSHKRSHQIVPRSRAVDFINEVMTGRVQVFKICDYFARVRPFAGEQPSSNEEEGQNGEVALVSTSVRMNFGFNGRLAPLPT